MKNFLIRTATALIFVIVLLGAILYGHTSFGALFLVITLLTVNEFSNLIHEYKKTTFSTLLAVVGGGYLFFVLYATTHIGIDNTALLFAPYILLIVYSFIRQLFSNEGSSLDNYAYFILTQVYAALPFATLNILSTAGATGGSTYSFILPLSIFIFIWSNDTGAFCCGCTLGRHKLWERISPKKTWEGFIGGCVVAMIAAYVISIYFEELTMLQWIGMAIVVVVSGTLGDLIESCMKREMGIKDSGNILPGHGGMLDRFDSTLLAAPSVLIYLSIIGIL